MKEQDAGHNEIVDTIRTKEERSRFLAFIEELAGRLFRISKEDAIRIIQVRVPECAVAATMRAVTDLPADPETVKGVFEKLERALLALLILRVDVAISPTDAVIEHMFSWVRREVGRGIILDVICDRTVLGGARFVFEGRYREYTLAKKIEKFFENDREYISKKFLHHAS